MLAAVDPQPVSPDGSAEEPRNLTQHVYERLIEILILGELRPGDVITERKMAERLNASRTPVREALGRLEAEGLVYKQASRGVTVSPFSAEKFIEILNIRQLLEGEAARLAAGNIETAEFAEIRRHQSELATMKDPSLADIWQADDVLHGAIAKASGNELLANMIRDLRRLTHVFNAYRTAGRKGFTAPDSAALLNALEGGDAAAAQAAMVEHIAVVKTEILDKLAGR
ncbi:GntR family transcriptional regulator [Rhizobium halophytocola]|uniref:DNA-binding GntR family transcriptional regulator n=1 Tax=Rhizobium halophytocola TaxID=735519 RepID=A0ABS4DU33_9HYPH|nr:GntR family transcriptional regulator [Rhizobium halophytocola]MBP1849210.1 DNA-binding GntR family transcriptional regulator [Rhizobium halophytocola]